MFLQRLLIPLFLVFSFIFCIPVNAAEYNENTNVRIHKNLKEFLILFVDVEKDEETLLAVLEGIRLYMENEIEEGNIDDFEFLRAKVNEKKTQMIIDIEIFFEDGTSKMFFRVMEIDCPKGQPV